MFELQNNKQKVSSLLTYPWGVPACVPPRRVSSWVECDFCRRARYTHLRWTSSRPPVYSYCCHLYQTPSQTAEDQYKSWLIKQWIVHDLIGKLTRCASSLFIEIYFFFFLKRVNTKTKYFIFEDAEGYVSSLFTPFFSIV